MSEVDFSKLMKMAQEMSTNNAASSPYQLSDIDKVINNQQLRILKATLPYLDVTYQSKFAMMIKCMELKKTMELYQSPDSSDESNIPKKPLKHMDILNDIRNASDEPQQKTLNTFIMLMNFKNLMQNMNDSQNLLTHNYDNEESDDQNLFSNNNTYQEKNSGNQYDNFLNMVNRIIKEKDDKNG